MQNNVYVIYMSRQSQPPVLIQDLEVLGATLRLARRSLGLTQVDAAQLSNVSPRLWNETERGKRRQLGLETVLRMLNTVGLDLMLAPRGSEQRVAGDSKA